MRIIHVHHHYWPVVGGLENVVKALAEGMAKLGHEVHVITSTYGAQNRPKEEEINGVYVHRVKSIRLIYPDLTYPAGYPVDLLKTADVVHGHSQNSLFTVKMIERAKKLGAKTALHFMAIDSMNDHPNPLIRLVGPYYAKRMLHKALKISDIKMVRAIRDGTIFKTKYGIDTYFVPDGIDEEFIRTPNRAAIFLSRYQLHEPFVLFLGRLDKLKGVDTLIKAMSAVRREAPELKAVITGSGDQIPYKTLAEKLGVKNRVIFTGLLLGEIKIGAIDASLTLTLPSLREAFPLVIMEAWARGKPVITTPVGDIPYRVKHGENGILIPPRNPKALRDAILLLFQDENLRRKLGTSGKKQIYTWSEIVTKLTKIYRDN